MEKGTEKLLVSDVVQKLPGILRTGCQVSLPLVGNPSIPCYLKEDVLRAGTREKIVISLTDLAEEYPNFAIKWSSLNDLMDLDSIEDKSIDMGFDVTELDIKKPRRAMKVLTELFKDFLALEGKEFGRTELSIADQVSFDTFMGFILRRRAMKVTEWLRGILGDNLNETRNQLTKQ
ncbi:unnamed protein product [Phytophthora lilii]|uniref:Unnamed protein product n=1 Tax=Phytophthora lilii TaxID=2077276 RepID=A0A9W6THR3_9STRA|nr:unnamed protein product [Phytophthora lilii]